MKDPEHDLKDMVQGERPFLQTLAADWYRGAYGDRGQTTLVLPGKRARLFLQRAIATVIDTPVWAPEVLTMEEFVFDRLGLEQTDDITLTLTLWEVISQTPDHGLTFEQFSGWAPIVLRDFNDVDLFLADARQVFTNLLEAREMLLWSPGEQDSLSPYEAFYLEFYAKLLGWYEALRELLLSRGTAYQGMAFRMLAEDRSRLREDRKPKQVVFAGFNALTPAEEVMIHTLVESRQGHIVWDADRYLLDSRQEAGHFMRRWEQRYPGSGLHRAESALLSQPREINVYGIHGHRAQTRFAGELLRDTSEGLHTAVVLPDESLLLPMMNSLPPHITRFNVTMGLSFRHTPALTWLNLNLQLLARSGRSSSGWIRVTHLIPLLRHPWMQLLTESPTAATGSHRDPVEMLHRRFYTHDALTEILAGVWPHRAALFQQWLSPVTHPTDFTNRMELLLRELLSSPALQNKPFDLGAILESLRILKRVNDSLPGSQTPEEGFTLLRFLLSRLLQQASIPFSGEPLEGLQLLGLLETRTLDFDHVILLSANERILPSARKPQTLIPWDIRRFHELPGVQHQDAIYAYHFYNLLRRAKRVDILYNTDVSSEISGEATRFIRQMESELVLENPSITYRHLRLSASVKKGEALPALEIPKSNSILETLTQLLTTRGLAPSNLSRYVRCPMMFYFSYVAGLNEPETFEEALDFRELGNLVHKALQYFYDPKQNGSDPSATSLPLNEAFLRMAIGQSDQVVDHLMRDLIGGNAPLTGRNMIIAEVAAFMVKGFLMKELEVIRTETLEILSVEQRLERTIGVGSGQNQIEIKFKGFADRIDRIGGVLRIGDYKTGKTEGRDLAFETVDQLFSDPGKEKALQLMCYAWLLHHEHADEQITAAIFTLKSPKNYQLYLTQQIGNSPDLLREIPDSFEIQLKSLIEEMLNPAIPFSQTDDTDICAMCAYQRVCYSGS